MKNGNLLVVLFGLLLFPTGAAQACPALFGSNLAFEAKIAILGTLLGDLKDPENRIAPTVRVDKVVLGKYPYTHFRIERRDGYCSDAAYMKKGDRIVVYLNDGPGYGVLYWQSVSDARTWDKRIAGKL